MSRLELRRPGSGPGFGIEVYQVFRPDQRASTLMPTCKGLSGRARFLPRAAEAPCSPEDGCGSIIASLPPMGHRPCP